MVGTESETMTRTSTSGSEEMILECVVSANLVNVEKSHRGERTPRGKHAKNQWSVDIRLKVEINSTQAGLPRSLKANSKTFLDSTLMENESKAHL